jgi:hypothetical protein
MREGERTCKNSRAWVWTRNQSSTWAAFFAGCWRSTRTHLQICVSAIGLAARKSEHLIRMRWRELLETSRGFGPFCGCAWAAEHSLKRPDAKPWAVADSLACVLRREASTQSRSPVRWYMGNRMAHRKWNRLLTKSRPHRELLSVEPVCIIKD